MKDSGKQYLFSNGDLRQLILPLIAEQFLVLGLGLTDTLMVASVGEAAISAISLVDIIANLIIRVLAALCTGGAVVVSQYLGRKDYDNAGEAAKQLMLLSVGLMSFFTVIFLVFCNPILRLAFGAIEPDVMSGARTYWLITTLSFPFLAAYTAATSIFRSISRSKEALNISILMNIINIIGNAILIYGFNIGVAGAAISTTLSRAAAGVIALALLRNRELPVCISDYRTIRPKRSLLTSICRVGIPGGVENSLFNLGKLLVQSIIAGLGTAALAANAVLNSLGGLALVPGMAIAYALITVVGRCVGAGEYEQAQYYTKKLVLISMAGMAVVNLPLLLFPAPLLRMFNLGPEAMEIAVFLLPIISLGDILLWSLSFTFPNALRAAGDVRYTMVVAFISMFTMRVALSYVFVYTFQLGVAGVWYSMLADWLLRSVFFLIRYASGKWKSQTVID